MRTGHIKIRYPENTLYLANSMQRLDGLTIDTFSRLAIHGNYSDGM